MAYSTLDDLKNQLNEADLIQLTDDADTGAVVTTVTDAMIAKADALIDSYIGARYAVPLTTVPAIITHYSAVIAIYLLFSRRSGAPDHIQKLYDNALAFLKAVQDGDITLGANDPLGDQTDKGMPVFSSSTRVFARDKMAGF